MAAAVAENKPPLLDSAGKPIQGEDGFLLPHYRTFAAVWNAISRTYRYTWDEAVKESTEDSAAMWRDCYIHALLQERTLPIANAAWSLEPENPKDTLQQAVSHALTEIIKVTPGLDTLRLYLAYGRAWYGRYGSQLVWGSQRVHGAERLCIRKHLPVNGDKIQFDYDDHSPAIFVNPTWASAYRTARPDESSRVLTNGVGSNSATVYGDRAPMLRLRDPLWRQRFVIAEHIPDDADYFDGEMAGGVHGVGLRSRIYWCWFMRAEMLGWMASFMQKVGTLGILLFFYDESNPEAKIQAETAANSISQKTGFAVPVNQGSNPNLVGIKQMPANTAGIDALRAIIADYWEKQIERLIVGQSMSSGSDSENGLGGTGKAAFARDTKFQILKSDARRQDETLTEDVVKVAQQWNFPEADFPIHFKTSLPDPEAKDRLDAGKVIFDMGVEVKVDELRECAGFSAPEPDDETVGGQDAMLAAQGGDPNAPPGAGQPPSGQPRPSGQAPPAREEQSQRYGATHYQLDGMDRQAMPDLSPVGKVKLGANNLHVQSGRVIQGHQSLQGKPVNPLRREQPGEQGHDEGLTGQLAGDIFEHGQAFDKDVNSIIEQAQKIAKVLGFGDLLQNPAGLQQVARILAKDSPQAFPDPNQKPEERLKEILQAGSSAMTEDDAYRHADEHMGNWMNQQANMPPLAVDDPQAEEADALDYQQSQAAADRELVTLYQREADESRSDFLAGIERIVSALQSRQQAGSNVVRRTIQRDERTGLATAITEERN